jgi:hypothetical protein
MGIAVKNMSFLLEGQRFESGGVGYAHFYRLSSQIAAQRGPLAAQRGPLYTNKGVSYINLNKGISYINLTSG